MGTYSIKELEKLSGVKAHTIRIWEKRYRIISPQRTLSNIRLYSDDDLKKIINVSLIRHHGLKISKVAKLSTEEINTRILDINESKPQTSIYIDQLTVSMIDMDEESFERILSKVINKTSFEQCMMGIVYPFMEKIGVLWQSGTINPAQEHFISNLIRQRIIASTAALPKPNKNTKAVLFLPEGELHEIGLLFFHYMLRNRGFKTLYLGQWVPHDDLKKVCVAHRPDLLVTSLTTSPSIGKMQEYINTLSKDFPKTLILVSGLLVNKTAFLIPKNVKPFYKATELQEILESI